MIKSGEIADAKEVFINFDIHKSIFMNSIAAKIPFFYTIDFARGDMTSSCQVTNMTRINTYYLMGQRDHEFYNTSTNFSIETPAFPIQTNKAVVYFDWNVLKVYDEMDDGTINTSKWTATNCSEGTGSNKGISLGTSGSLISQDLSSHKIIYYKVLQSAGGSGGSASTSITDGTNTQTIHTTSSSSSHTNKNVLEGFLYLDWANKKVYVVYSDEWYHIYFYSGSYEDRYFERDRAVYSKVLDISGFTSLKFKVETSSSGTAKLINFRIGKLNISDVSCNIYLSGDGGTTWHEVQNGVLFKFPSVTSSIKAKLTGSVSSTDVFSLRNICIYLPVKEE